MNNTTVQWPSSYICAQHLNHCNRRLV